MICKYKSAFTLQLRHKKGNQRKRYGEKTLQFAEFVATIAA